MSSDAGTIEDDDEVTVKNAMLIQSLVETDGKLESPINLDICRMKVIKLRPLRWFNYFVPPKKLKITNTGFTAILSAKWQQERPYLCDGPLFGNYVFSQIHFHWGRDAMYGSEHYIDGGSMPMELHAVFFKSSYLNQATALRNKDGVIILVYFLKLQGGPNPSLHKIINSLPFIQKPHTSVRLTPEPLSNILRPFYQDYFVYWGSIVTVHYIHTMLWIITREPIGVSSEQIAEFRLLNNEKNMPLLNNCRPLQEVKNRSVFHVCPSGSRYASLLPIPREPPSATPKEFDA